MFDRLVNLDDIDQEVALRLLEGRSSVSRGIVTIELSRKAMKDPSIPETLVVPEIISCSDSDTLLDWARDIGPEVIEVIEFFLSDPENLLYETFERLVELGVSLNPINEEPRQRSRVTYKGILSRALPATQDELIQALSNCPINRPASTVRQFIRRHKSNLWVDKMGRYHWNHEVLRSNHDRG